MTGSFLYTVTSYSHQHLYKQMFQTALKTRCEIKRTCSKAKRIEGNRGIPVSSWGRTGHNLYLTNEKRK